MAPGPEGAHGHGCAAREAPVDVRHEGGALLVARGDVADRAVPGEGVEQVEGLLAGHGEDVLAALGLEALHEQVSGGSRGSVGHGRECGRPSRDRPVTEARLDVAPSTAQLLLASTMIRSSVKVLDRPAEALSAYAHP